MDRVRIGFVGVGGMGQCAHLKNYVTLPECEVVAIAELKQNQAKTVAERYGIPRVYPTHEDMLAAEKLDGIVASQPFTRHGVLVPELLIAGIPVFIEKPLAGSIESGQKILDALESSVSWCMVGYHKRSDPAVMFAKAEIDRLRSTGELGKLKYVRILMPAGDWVAGGFAGMIMTDESLGEIAWDPPASDMDQKTAERYTEFVNYYIHQVNLMRHLICEPYKVTYADPSGVMLAVQSESGVAGTIEMSPFTTTIDWQEHALVCFEKGWIRIDLPAPLACNRPGTVEIYRDPGDGFVPMASKPQMPWVSAMRQQAANFIAAIKGEMEPLCTAQEAMCDLVIARDYIRLLTGR
jgi:predicted dehydrogenase